MLIMSDSITCTYIEDSLGVSKGQFRGQHVNKKIKLKLGSSLTLFHHLDFFVVGIFYHLYVTKNALPYLMHRMHFRISVTVKLLPL